MPKKPWSGRFNESTDKLVEEFTASVRFDQRLAMQDIRVSIAHTAMLKKQGILTYREHDIIVGGLKIIRDRIQQGQFSWSITLEDVHMNIEAALIDTIGISGKKLQTGRSRNDQIATDIRLWLREEIYLINIEIQNLQEVLLTLAEREVETIFPGFTHLQTAQPITFGHHIMAWFEMLQRDIGRFNDCNKRMNIMPLGSAALAGTSYPIDREYTAKLLKFRAPAENSIDAVSDRDFAIEFNSAASLLMMHLSRFSEELIIWSSTQFSFIEISDKFCTGSSIMPQKKNPDVPELIRGKSSRIFGNLLTLLTLMKSQPLAYNKDNQEDKEPIFDTVDNIKGSLKIFKHIIPGIYCNRNRMYEAAVESFSTATDLADYLVLKGINFRDAHEIVGKSVMLSLKKGCNLLNLPLTDFKKLSDVIEEDVFDILKVEKSVAARDHIGGTSPKQVKQAILRARKKLEEYYD